MQDVAVDGELGVHGNEKIGAEHLHAMA